MHLCLFFKDISTNITTALPLRSRVPLIFIGIILDASKGLSNPTANKRNFNVQSIVDGRWLIADC